MSKDIQPLGRGKGSSAGPVLSTPIPHLQSLSFHPCQCKDAHRLGSRRQEHLGARIGRGAGGEDVVHEEKAPPRHDLTVRHGEGVADVRTPGIRIPLLGRRRSQASERTAEHRQSMAQSHAARQNLRLVEPAPQTAPPVERDRHQPIPRPDEEMLGRLLGQEPGQVAQQAEASAVLGEEDGCPGDAPLPIAEHRPRQREVIFPFTAALAQGAQHSLDPPGSGERPAATQATPHRHPFQGIPASPTQGTPTATIQRLLAGVTGRGENQMQAGRQEVAEDRTAGLFLSGGRTHGLVAP